MKKKVIKVTETQLRETEGDAFKYIDMNNEYSSYNGNKEVSVSGNIDAVTPGEPTTSDKVAKQITPQVFNRYRAYGCVYPHSVRESQTLDTLDKKNPELDVLSDGDESDDITRIPYSIERKLDLLIDSMGNMTPKQVAMILNKLIESFDFSCLPISWRKDLIAKLNVMSSSDHNQIN